MTNQIKAREFLVGAVVGSLLGSVSALLLAPKSGCRLRKDLNNMYCDLTEQAQDMAEQVGRKGKCLVKTMGSQSHDWTDKAKCLLCGVKHFFFHSDEGDESEDGEDHEAMFRDLLIGSVIGGVLGVAAGLLLAPKAGSELREDIADVYEDVTEKAHDMADQVSRKGKAFAKKTQSRAGKWMDIAKSIVEEVSEGAQEKGAEFSEGAKNRMNDLMEWASLGYRVWDGLKKRR